METIELTKNEDEWWENYMKGLYNLDISWECHECGRPLSICICNPIINNEEVS